MHTLPSNEWQTWGLPSAVVSEGKVRYELTLHDATSPDLWPQIGWVTQSFARVDGPSNEGVGDDTHGWYGAGWARTAKWDSQAIGLAGIRPTSLHIAGAVLNAVTL